MARGPLTSTEPILDLGSTGPTLGQPVQPRFGLGDTSRGQLAPGLPKLGPELPCQGHPDREPRRYGEPQADRHDQQATSHGLHATQVDKAPGSLVPFTFTRPRAPMAAPAEARIVTASRANKRVPHVAESGSEVPSSGNARPPTIS